jgi:hypothetical protein
MLEKMPFSSRSVVMTALMYSAALVDEDEA